MPDQPARPLRLSVTAEGTMYPPSAQDRLLEVAQAADQAGVDYIDTSEHVLMGRGALLAGQGWEPPHLDMPQPESLVTLAAMAGATQRIKLVSSITIAPLRPAGLLAKMVATLHAISRGRFVLGVTASWQKDEYDALGVSFERRGEMLDDTIGACRVLWREAPGQLPFGDGQLRPDVLLPAARARGAHPGLVRGQVHAAPDSARGHPGRRLDTLRRPAHDAGGDGRGHRHLAAGVRRRWP